MKCDDVVVAIFVACVESRAYIVFALVVNCAACACLTANSGLSRFDSSLDHRPSW